MLPTLISIGSFRIYSYGVMLSLGLFVGLYYFWKMGRDEHWEEIALFDGFFLALLTYYVVGRVGYVLSNWSEFQSLSAAFSLLSRPGIAHYLGIAGSLVMVIVIARAKNWELWKVLDAFTVALFMILVWGSLGSLLNGSNPGRVVSWGATYPGLTEKVLPIDLWSLVLAILGFGVTSKIRKNFRFYSWYKGEQSVARDGLAACVGLLFVGVYYLFRAFLSAGAVNWLLFAAGAFLILFSLGLIYRRSGRSGGRVVQFFSIKRRIRR